MNKHLQQLADKTVIVYRKWWGPVFCAREGCSNEITRRIALSRKNQNFIYCGEPECKSKHKLEGQRERKQRERDRGRKSAVKRQSVDVWEDVDGFFEKRGIGRDVRDDRPYIPYTTADAELVFATACEHIPLKLRSDRYVSSIRRYVNHVVPQSPGLMMIRLAPPDLGLDLVLPELRPRDPIVTMPWIEKPIGKLDADERKEDWAKEFLHEIITGWKEVEGKWVPTGVKEVPSGYVRKPVFKQGELNLTPEELKKYGGKYQFFPAPTVAVEWSTRRQKDKDNGSATRFDMHRSAVPLFADAERVFLPMEGQPNADATLSRGEAVLSFPSVTAMPDDEELKLVAERYLAGRLVYLVPDSDYNFDDGEDGGNPNVRAAARLARSRIQAISLKHGLGIDVQIAVPIARPGKEKDGVGDLLQHIEKNLDDDLEVVGSKRNPRFGQEVAKWDGHRGNIHRDAEFMRGVASLAMEDGRVLSAWRTEDGEIAESPWGVGAFIKATGFPRKKALRALKSVVRDRGALKPDRELDFDLAMREGGWRQRKRRGGKWFGEWRKDRSKDFANRQPFTMAEGFPDVPLPRMTVREFESKRRREADDNAD